MAKELRCTTVAIVVNAIFLRHCKSEIEKLRRVFETAVCEKDMVQAQKDFECKKAVYEFAKQIREEIKKAYESNFNAKRERMDNQERPLTNLDSVFLAGVQGKIDALSGLDLFIEKLMEGVHDA